MSEEVETAADTILVDLRRADENGTELRRKLPGWGWLRSDRPQPFLCVHRRSAGSGDRATPGLLAPLGSHIVFCDGDRAAAELVSEIARLRADEFGACLVLEVWAGDASAFQPSAQLHLPEDSAVKGLAKVFEDAMAAKSQKLAMDYAVRHGFDARAPLRTGVNDDRVTKLGLEVAPVYRDPETGRAYPQEFRRLRELLSHVIKQLAYAFAHDHAHEGPLHYHELGPGEVEAAVWTVDAALADIADDFDLLLHMTPTNVDAAWEAFQSSGFRQLPEFHYRPLKVDPGEMKQALFSVPVETVDDPAFHHIFCEKREELDWQISMVRDRGEPMVMAASLAAYGKTDDGLIALARRILEQAIRRAEPTPALDGHAFLKAAKGEIARLRQTDPCFSPSVTIAPDVSGLIVSNGDLFIGASAQVAEHRVTAALQHEVGTHMVTYHNGARQRLDLLRTGFAGYESLQEGLAILMEYLAGALEAGRLRQLAARVLAAASVEDGADFIETFDLLRDQVGAAPRNAFFTAMRLHRGGGFTKDTVYLRGIVQLIEWVGEGGDIRDLFLGKPGFDQLHLVEEMRWRGLLEAPVLFPTVLESDPAIGRLDAIRHAPSIDTILEATQ
jgi:uncharacterized protein (TIGR02421 family)